MQRYYNTILLFTDGIYILRLLFYDKLRWTTCHCSFLLAWYEADIRCIFIWLTCNVSLVCRNIRCQYQFFWLLGHRCTFILNYASPSKERDLQELKFKKVFFILDIMKLKMHLYWFSHVVFLPNSDNCLSNTDHYQPVLAKPQAPSYTLVFLLLHYKYMTHQYLLMCHKTKKVEDITPVLRALHCRPMNQIIDFKILLLTDEALNGLGPKYMSDALLCYETHWQSSELSWDTLAHRPPGQNQTCRSSVSMHRRSGINFQNTWDLPQPFVLLNRGLKLFCLPS